MLKGYVGITDYDWYSFLAKQPKVDEVNFWKPSAKPFKALSQGDLFFFKLKAPYNAIAGYGYFHGYEILPAGYAWELFGKMNGSEDFHTMKKLINSNRPKASEISNGGSFDIGCVLLYAPVFFPQNQWVTMPNDMANEIVSGKGYDLSSGE
ncbi:MAG: HNH endonuclease, partial [Chthonomonadales bacterium]